MVQADEEFGGANRAIKLSIKAINMQMRMIDMNKQKLRESQPN